MMKAYIHTMIHTYIPPWFYGKPTESMAKKDSMIGPGLVDIPSGCVAKINIP
jgi:hypothetical protein